jgi:TetR/AcrR family transcriptional regulator, cholesterol catabolism regulator
MQSPPKMRDLILDKAAGLFAQKGVSASTVRQIAEAAGITSGTLYHHFKSKDEIVDEILRRYVRAIHENYEAPLTVADPRQRLAAVIRASLETAQAHPHATEIYQNDANYLSSLPQFSYLKAHRQEVQSAWLETINAGVASGAFRSDVDPRVFYRLIRDAVWLSVRWTDKAADVTDECVSIFLDGFASAPATG